MIDVGTLALLTLLGAVVGLDFVSFPQAMLSRPLVASTLAGALCGSAGEGLLVGALLECFALETMPFGASRYPEWGPAAVAAGALAAMPHADPAASGRIVPFAVLAGLLCAMAAGQSLVWLRRFNLSVAEHYREKLASGDAHAVLSVQRIGLVVDFARAGAVTLVFLLALGPMRSFVAGAVAAGRGMGGASLVGAIAVGVGGAAVWKVVHTTKGYQWWLLAGTLVGSGVAVLL